MVIHHLRIQSVKQIVALLLILLEQLQIFKYSFFDLHLVVITDGIFTEEIKNDDILFAI